MVKRLYWLDVLKTLCCILVVIGHFSQSMVKSNILPNDCFYELFHLFLGYFLVPLFFVCSGYVYQLNSNVKSFKSWTKNILKKLISLGIPYFVFCFAMWLFKNIFSSDVNTQTGGLFNSLFVEPLSPYWYLYYSFFIFVITPTFSNKKSAVIILIVSLCLRFLNVFGISLGISVIDYVLFYEFWFVLGMYLSINNFDKYLYKKKNFLLGIVLMSLFVTLIIFIYINNISFSSTSLVMGLIGCISFILVIGYIFRNTEHSKIISLLIKYTFPIFLMHTFFASCTRIILFKLNIYSSVIHIIFGLPIGVIGPILVAIIMKKTKWLEFVLYPGKFIKISSGNNKI